MAILHLELSTENLKTKQVQVWCGATKSTAGEALQSESVNHFAEANSIMKTVQVFCPALRDAAFAFEHVCMFAGFVFLSCPAVERGSTQFFWF